MAAAHDFAEWRILEVRQSGAVFVVRQKQIPKPDRSGFRLQFFDHAGRCPAVALELVMEALRMGLVNQIFPQDGFSAKVHEFACDIALNVSPRSLRVIKRQVYGAMFEPLAKAIEIAEREMLQSLQSEDFKEGVAHFLEKRPPTFTGK